MRIAIRRARRNAVITKNELTRESPKWIVIRSKHVSLLGFKMERKSELQRISTNIAILCHIILVFIACFSGLMLLLALSGTNPEGYGMGLFLFFYLGFIPIIILVIAAITFSLLSRNSTLIMATVALGSVSAVMAITGFTLMSLILIFVYIVSVIWAWKMRAAGRIN